MSDDDFYEDDDDVGEIVAAFRRGEEGVTRGTEALGDRDQSVVVGAVQQLTSSAPQTMQMPFLTTERSQSWTTTSTTDETTTGGLISA